MTYEVRVSIEDARVEVNYWLAERNNFSYRASRDQRERRSTLQSYKFEKLISEQSSFGYGESRLTKISEMVTL